MGELGGKRGTCLKSVLIPSTVILLSNTRFATINSKIRVFEVVVYS